MSENEFIEKKSKKKSNKSTIEPETNKAPSNAKPSSQPSQQTHQPAQQPQYQYQQQDAEGQQRLKHILFSRVIGKRTTQDAVRKAILALGRSVLSVEEVGAARAESNGTSGEHFRIILEKEDDADKLLESKHVTIEEGCSLEIQV